MLVRARGAPWTILRNGLYAELFGGLLMWGDDGVESAFGAGALAAVARADLAEAAAIIAADPARHGGRTYELVGTPITAAQVAAALGVPGRTIGLGEYRRRLLEEMPGLLPFQPPKLMSVATGNRPTRRPRPLRPPSDKWSVLVIVELAGGPRRFRELQRAIDGISQRMLTLTVRRLERDGLVARTVYPTVPAQVDYRLIGTGASLTHLVKALADWSSTHRPVIADARHQYDQTHPDHDIR